MQGFLTLFVGIRGNGKRVSYGRVSQSTQLYLSNLPRPLKLANTPLMAASNFYAPNKRDWRLENFGSLFASALLSPSCVSV